MSKTNIKPRDLVGKVGQTESGEKGIIIDADYFKQYAVLEEEYGDFSASQEDFEEMKLNGDDQIIVVFEDEDGDRECYCYENGGVSLVEEKVTTPISDRKWVKFKAKNTTGFTISPEGTYFGGEKYDDYNSYGIATIHTSNRPLEEAEAYANFIVKARELQLKYGSLNKLEELMKRYQNDAKNLSNELIKIEQ